MNKGLDKYEIIRILGDKMNENPDLQYYIENDNFKLMFELLISGIAEVIDENNRMLMQDISRRKRW